MGCNCQKPTIEKYIPEYNVTTSRSLCTSDAENAHLERPVSGLIEMEDLKSALLELLIRFDTNPNYYTREDFKKLLDILNHSLTYLYTSTGTTQDLVDDILDSEAGSFGSGSEMVNIHLKKTPHFNTESGNIQIVCETPDDKYKDSDTYKYCLMYKNKKSKQNKWRVPIWGWESNYLKKGFPDEALKEIAWDYTGEVTQFWNGEYHLNGSGFCDFEDERDENGYLKGDDLGNPIVKSHILRTILQRTQMGSYFDKRTIKVSARRYLRETRSGFWNFHNPISDQNELIYWTLYNKLNNGAHLIWLKTYPSNPNFQVSSVILSSLDGEQLFISDDVSTAPRWYLSDTTDIDFWNSINLAKTITLTLTNQESEVPFTHKVGTMFSGMIIPKVKKRTRVRKCVELGVALFKNVDGEWIRASNICPMSVRIDNRIQKYIYYDENGNEIKIRAFENSPRITHNFVITL